jgi:hypothetical protein
LEVDVGRRLGLSVREWAVLALAISGIAVCLGMGAEQRRWITELQAKRDAAALAGLGRKVVIPSDVPVALTSYGRLPWLFGLSVPTIGAAWFAVVLVVHLAAPRVPARWRSRVHSCAFALSIVALTFAVHLAYSLFFKLHRDCFWCVVVYVDVASIFVLSALAGDEDRPQVQESVVVTG